MICNTDVIQRKEAITLGLKHYFTGVPCKHGHVSKKYVSCSTCFQCVYVRYKAYQKTDACKQYHKQYQPKYNAANRESINAYSVDWYRRNVGKTNARVRLYKNRKINRTPSWANLKKIERIYQLAVWASRFTDEPLEVDHIIPMQGKRISGLHVHNNLQILKRCENRSKGHQWN